MKCEIRLVTKTREYWEQQRYATGTSLATPIGAGIIGLVAQKFPEATGSQLIQSVIHNTGVDDHELSLDTEYRYGSGLVSASHILRLDPTQYEDVNSLIDDGPLSRPTRVEIDAAAAAEEDSGDNEPSGGVNVSEESEVPWPPIAIVSGVLVLAFNAGIAHVLPTDSKRRKGEVTVSSDANTPFA